MDIRCPTRCSWAFFQIVFSISINFGHEKSIFFLLKKEILVEKKNRIRKIFAIIVCCNLKISLGEKNNHLKSEKNYNYAKFEKKRKEIKLSIQYCSFLVEVLKAIVRQRQDTYTYKTKVIS